VRLWWVAVLAHVFCLRPESFAGVTVPTPVLNRPLPSGGMVRCAIAAEPRTGAFADFCRADSFEPG
jgi:hypothetical protein